MAREDASGGAAGPGIGRELVGALVAAALAVWATVHAVRVREELLFFDGDSLVTTLLVRSLRSGQVGDWALSPVLFVPETLVHGIVTALTPDPRTSLVVASVVNLLARTGRSASCRAGDGPARLPSRRLSPGTARSSP